MANTDATLAAAAREAWKAKGASTALAAPIKQRNAVAAKMSARPLSPMVMDFEVEGWLMRILAAKTHRQQPRCDKMLIDRDQARFAQGKQIAKNAHAGSGGQRSIAWSRANATDHEQKSIVRLKRRGQSFAVSASALRISARAMMPASPSSPSITGILRRRCSTISCRTRVKRVSGRT